jgi:hypothetical protein
MLAALLPYTLFEADLTRSIARLHLALYTCTDDTFLLFQAASFWSLHFCIVGTCPMEYLLWLSLCFAERLGAASLLGHFKACQNGISCLQIAF